MANDSRISVIIGADTSQLNNEMDGAVSLIKLKTEEIKESLKGLAKTSDGMKDFLETLAPIGDAFFGIATSCKTAITSASCLNYEAKKMAGNLYTTTGEATILNRALGMVNSNTDEYQRATSMLSNQLNTGSNAFERLGVSIADTSGKLHPTNAIMLDTINKLNDIEQGTQRNTAGIACFGQSWGDMSNLMKLNNQVLDEATTSAGRYGVSVGGEAVSAQEKWNNTISTAKATTSALKAEIGQEFLSTIFELSEGFNTGGEAVEWLSETINGSMALIDGLEMAVRVATSIICGSILMTAKVAENATIVLCDFFNGDFLGAKQAFGSLSESVKNDWKDMLNEMGSSFGKFGDSLDKRRRKAPVANMQVGGHDTDDYYPSGQDNSSGTSEKQTLDELKIFKDSTAQKLSAANQFYEMSLTDEKAFWQSKLTLTDLSEKEYESLQLKMLDFDKNLRKERFDKATAEAKTAAAIEDGKFQTLQTLRLADLDDEASALHYRLAMGEINVQKMLELEKNLIASRFEIKMEGLQRELELNEGNIEAQQAVYNKLQVLNREFHNAINENAREMALEQRAIWEEIASSIRETMNEALIGLMNGTESWGSATQKVLNSVLQSFIKTTAQQLTQHMTIENLKSLFTKKIVAQDVATKATGALQSKTINVSTAASELTASAPVAGAKAFTAMANIPYVGPALGAAAMAAAIAGILALMGKLNSAAGGWGEVPSDQLAMVHKKEMVLPAKYAEPLREQLEDDEFGGGSPVIIQLNAIDAKGSADWIKGNAGAFRDLIKSQMRDFAFN